MAKPYKPKKDHNKDSSINTQQQEIEKSTKSLSKLANTKIEESLKDFGKLSENERKAAFGDKEFFDQFWDFFKEENPSLLEEIEKEDITIYIKQLEKKGFSIENLLKKQELQEEFKETNNEKDTIKKSIEELQKYCQDGQNKMPANIFENFAKEVNFITTPRISINNECKISKIGNLSTLRKEYLSSNDIKLKDYQTEKTEKMLCPRYLPTERLLISATIKKLKKNLPDGLIGDFETNFPLPIDIHSNFQTLKNLKNERELFLQSHKGEIDEDLAKKLDKTLVTNGDIYKELEYEGEEIDRSKGFSEQTKNFRLMFNKLATRQIFDEVKENRLYIDHHLENLGKEFREFPPYINQLFKTYQYKEKEILSNPENKKLIEEQQQKIDEHEKKIGDENISDEQREPIVKEIKKEKEKLNQIKWKAYADYISKQEPTLGKGLQNLIENNFDINKLDKIEQQKILDVLIKSRLEDSIKNKIPQTLQINPDEYKKFVDDLFDLEKKDIIIKTQYGDVPIHFLEKSFLGGPSKEFMEIKNSGIPITDQKNLPLNFRIQITDQNKDFFENNPIYNDLFTTFNSKNQGEIKINDSYNVSLKRKDGTTVKGYLSATPPTKEIEQKIEESKLGKTLFLYSHPITKPEDAREVMTRNGKSDGEPVMIQEDDENKYDLDILSREINLNGDGIGSLLFSNALGQHSIEHELTTEQEKKLQEKFGKLGKEDLYTDTYDKNGDKIDLNQENHKQGNPKESVESGKEKNLKEFLEGRKNLKGHQTPEETTSNEEIDFKRQGKFGFKNGAKLLVQTVESNFKPDSNQYMSLEINNIDINEGTFKITSKGVEESLGKREGKSIKMSLNKNSLDKIKDIFEEQKIFKLPDGETRKNFPKILESLTGDNIDGINVANSFGGINRDGNNFKFQTGENQGKTISHFGLIETYPGQDADKLDKVGYMYKIEHNPNKKTFKLIANDKNGTILNLDYPNFILFVSSKNLQPQTEESAKAISIPEGSGTDPKNPKKWKGYSVASVIGFFSNFGKKIGEQLKKYEEEQTEDLTDKILFQGKFFDKLSKIMPTTKRKQSFENAGNEYLTERDNKVWKKVEKYIKFYESDPDFGSDLFWKVKIKPLLDGDKKPRDHHELAAILVTTIKGGKGPYSRNTDRAGKGKWIKLLFGEEHQKRYFKMKSNLELELKQGKSINGQIRADDKQNEILKLEMKYIVDCIDGRHLQEFDDVPRLQGMYSKKYASELETTSNEFFDGMVSKQYEKAKNFSFEFARFEYFRLLGDRPQQAIPSLKQMAMKAVTQKQRDVFKAAVLTGMMSGIFNSISQEDKKFIQKICRSQGFLPGLLVRGFNHQEKISNLIEIILGEKHKGYSVEEFSFGKMKDTNQIKKFAKYDEGFPNWLLSEKRINKISDFVSTIDGKNHQGKTIIQLLDDPKTPKTEKELLKEIYDKNFEINENLDPDLHQNGKILQQNILTKNQSHINEIIGFESGSFKGKNEDEKQDKDDARSVISRTIPRKKMENKNEIVFILKKFFNRFRDYGFNAEEKRFLVRTLLTVKDLKNDPSSEDILWYTIVGNTIKNSGSGQPPDNLIFGLEAFKDFFKNNIDSIIKTDIIEEGFGGSTFSEELEKGPYKVAPWSEYVDLQVNKQNYIIGASQQDNKIRQRKKQLYNVDEKYINSTIYKMAEGVDNKNSIRNKFKKYYDPNKKTTTIENLHQTLKPDSINIKNTDTISKIEQKIDSKTEGDIGLTEENLAAMDENYDEY